MSRCSSSKASQFSPDKRPRTCAAAQCRRRRLAHRLAGQGQGAAQRLFVAIGIHVARQHHPQQARMVVATLGIAAVPEQVLHHPRRQVGILADQVAHAEPARSQRLAADCSLGQHPGVLARPAALHRHHLGIRRRGYAGQAAGHHPVASVGGGDGEHAHADGPRLQADAGLAVAPDRCLGQLRQALRHVGLRALAQALAEGCQAGTVEGVAEQRFAALAGKGRLDHQVGQCREYRLEGLRLAAPAGVERGQRQFLAKQAATGLRQ